jgi:hypothetical protein
MTDLAAIADARIVLDRGRRPARKASLARVFLNGLLENAC